MGGTHEERRKESIEIAEKINIDNSDIPDGAKKVPFWRRDSNGQIIYGGFFIVDEEDFDWIIGNLWSFGRYINRYKKTSNGRTSTGVQKEIMERHYGKYGYNTKTDHINGDTKDNRKSNLRLCGARGNRANSKPTVKTSKYKGVRKVKNRPGWEANIWSGKTIYLGYFRNEEAAAIAYNKAAIKYFGEYARLNEVS